GIQLENFDVEALNERCQEWYNMLLLGDDREEIIATYNELHQQIRQTYSSGAVMFEIHKIRYYLFLNQYDNALRQINNLNEISGRFNSLHLYYWYKFKGIYASIYDNDFTRALRLYKLAEDNVNHLELQEMEVADLNYIIAVMHSKLRNTLESIDYANTALDIY